MNLDQFKKIVEKKGVTWALKSSNLMDSYLRLAIKCHEMAQQYPFKNWYAPNDPRKKLIEKRNDYLNQYLNLLRQWGFEENISLLRPWQEKCDDIFSAASEFYRLEQIAIQHGIYRVG